MRLVECLPGISELRLIERFGDDIPPYAILSHTWAEDAEEVTYQDMVNKTGLSKAGYEKIKFCAERARHDKLEYFWIDTCCIDKTNSVELTEAINSMFNWYQRSSVCYVYLSDLRLADFDPGEVGKNLLGLGFYNLEAAASNTYLTSQLRACKWFTRGWTVQELLAPAFVQFWSCDNVFLGTKGTLLNTISRVTRVDERALCSYSLTRFDEETRLSWAKDRRTKRPEDAAYSMLGIFGVRMRPDYGEGRQEAFNRLHRKMHKLRVAQGQQALSEDEPDGSKPENLSHFRGITVRLENDQSQPLPSSWVVKGITEFDPRGCALQPPIQTLSDPKEASGAYSLGYARLQVRKSPLSRGYKIVYCRKRDLQSDTELRRAPELKPSKKKKFKIWSSSRPETLYIPAPSEKPVAEYDFILERTLDASLERLKLDLRNPRTTNERQGEADTPVFTAPGAENPRGTMSSFYGGYAGIYPVDLSVRLRRRAARQQSQQAETRSQQGPQAR